MKVSDILILEKENRNSVFLLKEVLFYRAYETSAYLFVNHIQKYSVTKKFIKVVNQEILHVGFPSTYLQNILQKTEGKEIIKTENKVEIKNFAVPENYKEWKETIDAMENAGLPVVKQKIDEMVQRLTSC
jgi:CRISPR/Cas system-associated protein Csx1